MLDQRKDATRRSSHEQGELEVLRKKLGELEELSRMRLDVAESRMLALEKQRTVSVRFIIGVGRMVATNEGWIRQDSSVPRVSECGPL